MRRSTDSFFLPLNRVFVTLFLCFGLALCGSMHAQDGFESGDGWGGEIGWGNRAAFAASAGPSFIFSTNNIGTGNQYFRLGTGGTVHGPTGCADELISPETEYVLGTWGGNCGRAYYMNVGNSNWNYIFKSPNQDGNSNIPRLIAFEVQGAVESVTSVSQTPAAVTTSQNVAITATVSGAGALPAGQGVYLRYTTDGFATSTIVEMAYVAGNNYASTIPAAANSNGANIIYYVFTSGDGLTVAHNNADWYTINLNNNGGLNYFYSVGSVWTTNPAGNGFWSDPNMWDPGTVPPLGVDVLIEDPIILDQDAEVGNMGIIPTGAFTGSDATPRNLSIQGGGTLANAGIFNAANGKITFLGIGTVNGGFVFNDVDINGGIDFGGVSAINGVLSLKSGSFVSANPPVYNVGSTLEYATGDVFAAPYGRFLEWTNPYHVRIVDNTWFDLHNGANFTPQFMRGDLDIVAGGLQMNDMERALQVDGNVSIHSNGELRMANFVGGDLWLQGNLTNNGVFDGNNRTVKFNGSGSPQTINGTFTGTNRFHYFDIESLADISLATDIEIEDTLRFITGLLHLNNFDLTYMESAVSSDFPLWTPSATSFLTTHGTGVVIKRFAAPSSFLFPVGDSSGTAEYSPCRIAFTSGTFGANASLAVSVDDSKHPLNLSLNHFLTRFWEVEETDMTAFTYDATFSYLNADISGLEPSIEGWKSDDGGVTWQSLGALNMPANEIIASGQANFSIFTGGEIVALPVELLSFQGQREGQQVRLDWTTSVEINNDYFEVEHSTDNIYFEPVGQVQGQGNSQSAHAYTLRHSRPVSGINYYRLKQVDFDGSIYRSSVIAVLFDSENGLDVHIWQENGVIKVRAFAESSLDLEANVYDLAGRKILSKTLPLAAGENLFLLNGLPLGAGNLVLVDLLHSSFRRSVKLILD